MLFEPNLTEEQIPFWNFFMTHNLWKPGYMPQCENHDSTSTQASKFGGSCPHLSQDPVPVCPLCQNRLEVLLQLYIPSLPEQVRQLFAPSQQQSLIVFYYCTDCMESNSENALHFKIFNQDDLQNVVFDLPPNESKINPAVIVSWIPFKSIDGTTETFYQIFNGQNQLDEVAMEEFHREIKRQYAGTTYLLGNPDFTEGEYGRPEGMINLACFQQDNNFSMMWGDAGYAHLWMMPGDENGQFNLIWFSG